MDKGDVCVYTHTHTLTHTHTYLMEYYSVIKKNEILTFATTQMDFEGIMQSEISQTNTNTVLYHLYVKLKIQ